MNDALVAGAAGAWIHGRAAELAGEAIALRSAPRAPRVAPRVRGVTLDDVLASLPLGWPRSVSVPRYPVLFELPAVGERS